MLAASCEEAASKWTIKERGMFAGSVEDWQTLRMEISSGITKLVLCLIIVNFGK